VLSQRLLIIFLLFILSVRICSQQQNYVFQHITTKDGLTSDAVRFIFQDSKGSYWLGYDDGFQKFDGKNFATNSFGNEYIKSDILENNLVKPVEDTKGRIFVFNQGAVYVYNPDGKVDTIRIYDYADDGFSNIEDFCKDEWGNIWIVTQKSIYKYNKDDHKCELWSQIGARAVIGSITHIVYDFHKKCIWLMSGNDILLVDLQSKKITEPFLTQHPGETDLPKTSFIVFWMDSNQNIWLSSWNGILYKYNTITYKKEMFDAFNYDKSKKETSKSIPLCFAEDKQKRIWIGCYNGGIYYYDEKTNTVKPARFNKNIANSLHYDHTISALYKDNEGNIWAGTDKGISIFNPSFQQFTTIDENNAANPFPKSEVNQIFQTSKGNILVSTYGNGWFSYDKDFRLKNQFYDTSKANDNQKNLVWSFAEDREGKIWIGYQHGLVGIFNPVNKNIQYIEVPEFEKKTIMTMRCDAKGNMWFGLYSGFLGEWDVVKHKFLIYRYSLDFPYPNVAINDILINRQDELWVATAGNGFYCFNPIKGKITEWYPGKEKNFFFYNVIKSLTQINDSVIGLSTKYYGFVLFNQIKKSFSSFTKQNGLPVNVIGGLATDKQNRLWIATGNGLLRMNEQHNKLVSFDEEDGLLQKGFYRNIVTLNDGRMVVPALTGFVYFSPGSIKPQAPPPDVKIIGFKIFDQSLQIDSLLFPGNTVELNHQQNFITIGFTSLSFLNRNTTQYYYQLQGIDKNWVKAGTQRFAIYTNLSPGYYTFKVKCENRDGIPSKHITELAIYISPPWWFTWWAYALYFLLAIAMVYILYRNRIKRLERKQSTQISIMVATQEEERKRISRDLHDDVGTKLSALKLFLSSLNEKASHSTDREIRSLAESSEQFITEAMQDVRRLLLNLSPAVLEEFGYAIAVEGLVNKINETKQIHFSLVMFGMNQRLRKDYELALYRITQELINNVLKHAEAKHVSLQIGQRDEKIILMIEDDGKGFDVTAHKDGYGLHNLEARTNLMQGVLTIDSKPGKGTSVLIEIPDNFN
jgi:signal transduction histidine kinase/ligand-binding sensor domain-containing protein